MQCLNELVQHSRCTEESGHLQLVRNTPHYAGQENNRHHGLVALFLVQEYVCRPGGRAEYIVFLFQLLAS